jgi:hypothetical protein
MLDVLVLPQHWPMLLRNFALRLLALPISISLAANYFQPNATGIKIQNGFERVYVQVSCAIFGLSTVY